MNVPECEHIRIRQIYNFGTNVENFIKYLEFQHKVDIRTIPQWQDAIKRLYSAEKEFKTRLQNASVRKRNIIENLYIQKYRQSPFTLTQKFARTSKVWKEIELNIQQKRKTYIKAIPESIHSFKQKYISEEQLGEDSDIRSTAHPNTEIVEPKEDIKDKLLDADIDVKSDSSVKLPAIICTNPHKLLSPLGSHCTPLSHYSSRQSTVPDQINDKELPLNLTNSIKCYPEAIKVIYNEEQLKNNHVIKFSLRNCINEWVFIRFMGIPNRINLKKFRLMPNTPVKLYAGLSMVYCLHFKLNPNATEFEGVLNFKIGHVAADTPDEILSVRFTCEYLEQRSIEVTESVLIPSTYLWKIGKVNYPCGNITIRVKDKYSYHLHIKRRDINWSEILDLDSVNSLDVQAPTTESIVQRNDDVTSQNLLSSSSKFNEIPQEEVISIDTIVSNLLMEVIDNSLQCFVLDKTYFYLEPGSVYNIRAIFTKAEHIGSHHCSYDLDFINPNNNNLVMTKRVRVFSEILPHPIQIEPIILDMTNSTVKFGFCIDYFTIINKHKFIPVTIKIKLTKKMKKLFQITPMEVLIPALSKNVFQVRLCPRSGSENSTDCVHFTIKIIVIGDKTVYENVPPFFYELLIPCSSEFKRLYGRKYFDSALDLNDDFTEASTDVGVQQSKMKNCL
ncbi:unnamed protein product [Leptosia nina]|uniref:Uncharacterized protein n=1 Tax=Leptosia nina TaxID=320188 RepID=A0AAV1JTE0_9NEOP